MTPSLELHSRKRKDGRQLIQVRINDRHKKWRISSEIYVKKTQFNKDAEWLKWVRYSHPEAEKLNKQLETLLIKARDHYNKHKIINPAAAIQGTAFIPFAERFYDRYNNLKQQGTYRTYKAKLSKLKEFAGVKIDFGDITVSFLDKYITHLKTEKGNSVNTISVDLRKIRAIFCQAIKEDIIGYESTPFRKISIATEKAKKERLTLKEIQSMRKLKLSGIELDARNIFLFCINTMGMRVGDAMRLKWSDINKGKLTYQMHKTGNPMQITLTKEALKIAKSYKNKPYVFPFITDGENEFNAISRGTALINKWLKKVAFKADIKKRVTTHISRHTFSQLAIDSGANPRTLQKALGHSCFGITENYIRDLNFNDVDEMNKNIFG